MDIPLPNDQMLHDVIDASDAYRLANHHLVQEVIRQIYHVSGNEVAIYRTLSQRFLASAGFRENAAGVMPEIVSHIDDAVRDEIENFVQHHVGRILTDATAGTLTEGILLLDAGHILGKMALPEALTQENLEAVRLAAQGLQELADDLEQDFNRRMQKLVTRTADSPIPYTDYQAYRASAIAQRTGGNWQQRYEEALPLFPKLAALNAQL